MWSDEAKARLEEMVGDPAHFDHTVRDTQAIRAALGEIERRGKRIDVAWVEEKEQRQRAEAAEEEARLNRAAAEKHYAYGEAQKEQFVAVEAEVARLRAALDSMVNCPVGGSGQRLPTPEAVARARADLAPEVKP